MVNDTACTRTSRATSSTTTVAGLPLASGIRYARFAPTGDHRNSRMLGTPKQERVTICMEGSSKLSVRAVREDYMPMPFAPFVARYCSSALNV